MGGRLRRVFTVCRCGATYTLREWRALKRIGILDVEAELAKADPTYNPAADPFPPFEMRDCVCGSTISAVIPYPGGSHYPPRALVMRYCKDCQEASTPAAGCKACAAERARQVATLARDIFVRSIARKTARKPVGATFYKEHALEAFLASDDFLAIAEDWTDRGRDELVAQRQGQKKKPKG